MSAAPSRPGAGQLAGAVPRGRAGRSLLWLGLAIAVAAAASLAVSRSVRQPSATDLAPLATLPDFHLTEASGRPVSRADLAGAPWVASLVFTRCAGQCPAIMTEMARLARNARDLPNVRFVSLTCDPENDTPAVLEDYATRHGVDRARWLFLTGDKQPVRALLNEGFHLAATEGDPANGDDAVIHSSRLALVDGAARIRGFYDAGDAEAMLHLQADLRALAAEPAQP